MSPPPLVQHAWCMTLLDDAPPSSREGAGGGVCFPLQGDARPSTPTARAIFGAAADSADPVLGRRFRATENWRADYVGLVRDLTEVSSHSQRASLGMARAGLQVMADQMVFGRSGRETALAHGFSGHQPAERIGSADLTGTGTAVTELEVPYQGTLLRRATLLSQLNRWVDAGIVEPSFAVAISRVVAHPEWLALPGQRVMIIGAGSEMGPLQPLSQWGARLIAVDVPRKDVWDRVIDTARRGSGTVTVPAAADGSYGLDLLTQLPEARRWVDDVAGDDDLTIGMYAYADRGLHVRVTAAVDTLAADVLRTRPDTSLAYLGTPTDAYMVDAAVVAHARDAYRHRRFALIGHRLTNGRLFAPAYADHRRGANPVADVLVAQQGPNYALAKRLQRWRGITASCAGHKVSFNVAPATWTRSVTSNRVLAAAYAGAPRFGAEIFEADTARVLMAALLVHDLQQAPPAATMANPEEMFINQAAHSGLWRAGYDPRSVLGLAAALGASSRRRR